jgi:hypothetical protein
VAALAPEVQRRSEGVSALLGIISGVSLVFGLMLGLGHLLLGSSQSAEIALAVATVGGLGVLVTLKRQLRSEAP